MFKFLLTFGFVVYSCSVFSQVPDYYFSNLGSDSSDGTTSMTPRRTLTGSASLLRAKAIASGTVQIGLKAGDVFKEAYKPNHLVHVSTYNNPSTPDFAIFDGAKSFNTGWVKADGMYKTYQQAINYTSFAGYGTGNLGSYSYLYVYEIDKTMEAIAPFTSRRLLALAPSQNAVDTLKGSFYETPSRANPMLINIHTSDGRSPNNHPRYRYEVTVLDKAIDARFSDSNHFENLWVRGFGAGGGPLPGGADTRYKSIIFGPGAAIHHAVPKSGTFERCLFLPGPENTNGGGAIVFYNDQGFYRSNTILRSIFLDIPFPVYAHTSGTPYQNTTIKNSLFFGLGTGRALSGANTRSIVLDSLLIRNFARGYQSSAPTLSIKNSHFVDLSHIAISILGNNVTAEIDNVFVNGTAPFGIIEGNGTNLKLSHSILHLANIFLRKDKSNKVEASGNIFVLDSERSQGVFSMTDTDAGAGTSTDRWNNNVYILLKGKAVWQVSNKNTNSGNVTVDNLHDWQKQSGQDKNSLFFDLRNDRRGLKAVFIDPENGNYTIANTVFGNKIKILGAGMITPPTCFLNKPTYEAAADMIKTNNIPQLNGCKAPCQKNALQIQSDRLPDNTGVFNICKNEKISFVGTGSYPENGRRYTQNDSTSRFLWWSSNETDTSGVYLKSLTKSFDSVGLHTVKLQMVDANGCSEEVSVSVNVRTLPNQPDIMGDTIICPGQKSLLNLKNEIAGEMYFWNNVATARNSIEIENPGIFWVRATNSFGCALSDTIEVEERIAVKVYLGEDKVYCHSSPLVLTPLIEGSVQSITWNNGYTGSTFTVTAAGVYSVIVHDTGSCIGKDTIVVKDNPLNQFILPKDTAICEGSTLKVNLSIPQNTTITWNDNSTAANRILGAGQYSLALLNDNCGISGGFDVAVKPIPSFVPFRDTTVCDGFEVVMNASSPGATYLWSTGSKSDKIVTRTGGTYWGQAYFNGCFFRDTVILKTIACDCDIILPNAFSPNGDGINDVYVPLFSCYPKNYSLKIFDRYGKELFQTNDFKSAWSGVSSKGILPVGTYYYVLSFYDLIRSQNVKRSGSITLLK